MKKAKSKLPAQQVQKQDAMPDIISSTGFVDEFERIHRTMPNRQFAFILGAGASKSSEIKLASEMVAEWTTILHRNSNSYPTVPESTWATAENLKVHGYNSNDPAASYPAFYHRMFATDPDQGYAYLEDQMAKADPNYGYSVLGRILANERHRVVVTVNFDNLVADSISIFSTTYPLVCGHESLAQFARVDLRRPLVLKVHRDLLLNPMSDVRDLASPEPAFAAAIETLLQRYTPIVIGYGGNDDSLMQCLESIKKASIPGGVYWCYRESGSLPPQRILDFVANQNGKLVPILGFDELMVLLGGVLNIGNPKEDLLKRAQERVDRLAAQLKKLEANIEQAASKQFMFPTAPEELLSSSDDQAPEVSPNVPKIRDTKASGARSSELDTVAKELEKLSGQVSSGKRWWQWAREAASEPNLEKRDKIFRDALASLPESHELMGEYATFLHVSRRNDTEAESLYKRAITPASNAVLLANYAVFIQHVKKDESAAEQMFKRAVEVGPKNVYVLGKYADFLRLQARKEEAEALYRRMIELEPKNATSLGNYAWFLANVIKDTDAAEAMYKRAIEADPNYAHALGNYALFLENVRKDFDAAEALYKLAIEADPKYQTAIGNYALFLENVRKDFDGAEALYKRAIVADPKYQIALANYALFLNRVLKDYDAAEAMYKRALETDPNYANALNNYAYFLEDVRKDFDAAEAMYKRAIEADRKEANSFGNYCRLLLSQGKLADGLARLNDAITVMNHEQPTQVNIEAWMYAYCLRPESARAEALGHLKRLVKDTTIRTDYWDFSGVIAQAAKRNHLEAEWLPKLAEVLSGRAEESTLSEWVSWRDAA